MHCCSLKSFPLSEARNVNITVENDNICDIYLINDISLTMEKENESNSKAPEPHWPTIQVQCST